MSEKQEFVDAVLAGMTPEQREMVAAIDWSKILPIIQGLLPIILQIIAVFAKKDEPAPTPNPTPTV